MGRIHAFELEDQPWFPRMFREAGMAFLRFGAERLGQADAIRPVIEDALERSGETQILDLCSGGGGPVLAISASLRRAGRRVSVTMTDLYPDANARRLIGDEPVDYDDTPVDATDVPAERDGLRTMFNAFHHFRPEPASQILGSAVRSGRSIAVVEVLRRSPLALVGMLFVPIITLFVLPFLRPFRWWWVPFTYAIPIIPLFVWWDGTISVLRAYNPPDMRALIERADPDGAFDWQVRDLRIKGQPVPGVAVIGMPRA